MRNTTKLISLVILCCLFHSCERKLPSKQDNYDELFSPYSIDVETVEIPCIDELTEDVLHTSVVFAGGHETNVVESIFYNMGTYFVLMVKYYNSTELILSIPTENPNFYGIKSYRVTPENEVSPGHVNILYDYSSFSDNYLEPAENGNLYVVYKEDHIIISFCDLVLASEHGENVVFTGQIKFLT